MPAVPWPESNDKFKEETWNVKRVLTDFPGMLTHPDGELDEDGGMLYIAFDCNRHDVIYWEAKLP